MKSADLHLENKRENQNEETNSDDSFWSSNSNQDKLDSDYCKTNYESLRNEIKELRNDLKTWMEKIAASLNIIASFITQNHIQKFQSIIRESSISTLENAQEINQTDVVIHRIEDYQKFRDKISFWNICQKWIGTSWLKIKKEYSKMLQGMIKNFHKMTKFFHKILIKIIKLIVYFYLK